MACSCDSKMGCSCALQAGEGISISGIGTAGDPFLIESNSTEYRFYDSQSISWRRNNIPDVPPIAEIRADASLEYLLTVADTATVDMTLTGEGITGIPFVLSAVIKGLILTGGTTGQVITLKPDGTWGPGAMTTAPVGSVATANGIQGDGSGASPVRIKARTYAEWEAVIDASVF